MRVTSRRIRAAMPLFKECFPKKRYKKWLNEIKKVTRFLGSARDLDVQIVFLKDHINNLPSAEPKTGMQALLQRHIEKRTYLQQNIISGLQEFKNSKVLQQMTSCCEQAVKQATTTFFNLFDVREKTFWQISSKLDEFLAMEEYVHKENEILKHHEMRIRAKWLRYTMQTFAPLYAQRLSGESEMVKNFQDTLGEMHDCDVWIERIPKFIKEAETQTAIVLEIDQTMIENNQDLLKFLEHIKGKEKNNTKIL
jgi:CHAD domain-containing protein